MYPAPSAVDLYGRALANGAGDTCVVVDIRLDPCSTTCEFDIELLNPDGTPAEKGCTVTSLAGWVLLPEDITPEAVIAGSERQPQPRGTEHDTCRPARTTSTPFTPENIACIDGRFFHDGLDVTERPVAWLCAAGHSWWATLAHRTSRRDTGCPECAAASTPPRPQPRSQNTSTKRRRKR
jgi:hypothetical protein